MGTLLLTFSVLKNLQTMTGYGIYLFVIRSFMYYIRRYGINFTSHSRNFYCFIQSELNYNSAA